MAFALLGLSLQSPAIHFSLAALGIIPFWFPSGNPVDLIYNHLLKPLWGGVKLPPNPLQRRIACFMGGSMNLAIGIFFLQDMTIWAYGFGGILICLQIVVISTHFCLASWMYDQAFKLTGFWEEPLSSEEFLEKLRAGAMLIDVRSPDEYASKHLPDALNIPLERLGQELKDENQVYILYCASGLRSMLGTGKLRNLNFKSVFNLGGMGRAMNWK
jgi:rhodanese-related sulfurtransferase